MDRRKFILWLGGSVAAIAAAKPDAALAQAVECYNPQGMLVHCPAHGIPLPFGIVRRSIRRRRRRRRVRRVMHHRRRRRVRRRGRRRRR